MNAPDYQLVIFDCDGVLIDSEPIANRVFAEQLSLVGLSITVDEVMQKFLGKTRSGCLSLAGELLGRALPESFARAWDTALFAALSNEVKAIDGVAELLRDIKLPYCVATNSTHERMRVALRAAGLATLFEGRMFSAADVPHPKPAPDLFLHAAKSLGAAPARCAVIEDSATGVRAAVAAGMTVFGYVGSPYSSEAALAAEGAKPFEHMRDLATLLFSPCVGADRDPLGSAERQAR